MRFLGFLVTSLIVSVASVAAEKNKACLFDGSVRGNPIKDCMFSENMADEQFKQMCSGLARFGNALGATMPTITYLKECPANPQATCAMTKKGQKLKAYYYKRDAQLLADSQKSCTKMGGVWGK